MRYLLILSKIVTDTSYGFPGIDGDKERDRELRKSRWTDVSSSDYGTLLVQCEKRKEALEARLSGMRRDFEVDKKTAKADTAVIVRLLPPGSVYSTRSTH